MPLARDVTDAFILKKYDSLLWPTGRTVLQHAWEVGEASAKLMRSHLTKIWGECPPVSIAAQIDQVEHAGLLYAAMQSCSTTFEDLCQLASLEVARIVSDISADVRLPEPQRIRDRIGRVGGGADGKLLPQVVVLADMLCTVRHYGQLLEQEPAYELLEWMHRDLETRDDLLGALTQVRDSRLLDGWWVKARNTINEATEQCRKLMRAHQLKRRIDERARKETATAGHTCRTKPKI